MSVGLYETLTWGSGLDTRVRIPVNFSPMLWNWTVRSAWNIVAPPLPLLSLNPTSWAHTHIQHTNKQKTASLHQGSCRSDTLFYWQCSSMDDHMIVFGPLPVWLTVRLFQWPDTSLDDSMPIWMTVCQSGWQFRSSVDDSKPMWINIIRVRLTTSRAGKYYCLEYNLIKWMTPWYNY
jgi:hypothetical protein